jgi:hypothetical protein
MKWSAERRKRFEAKAALKNMESMVAAKESKSAPVSTGRIYHGWILVEDGGPGYKDYIRVEWSDEVGRHSFGGHGSHDGGTGNGWRGESGAARAVEWWDKKIGSPIKLQPILKGSYRVYTE